jgi:hypothetical protein
MYLSPLTCEKFYIAMYTYYCTNISSLKVLACLRDLRRQCSQPLLSVSLKDITNPAAPVAQRRL